MNIKKFAVVNWHITETCNYGCKFCYSKWGRQVEVWENPANVEKVISNICNHFQSEGCSHIRLSIVGGEPILFPQRLWQVVECAHQHKMEISIITNGSHLENIRPFAHLISQVGISIDSLEHETNLKIGRECGGKTISFEALSKKIEDIRNVNPEIQIKLNTVVNQHNFNEVLVNHFAKLHIDKWKILRQIPFNGNPGITDYQFYAFLRNNYNEELMQENAPLHHGSIDPSKTTFGASDTAVEVLKRVIYIEDNDVMTQSYLMVSPDGRLFQNGSIRYRYSRPLTEVSFAEALKSIDFDISKFAGRYGEYPTLKAVHEMQAFFHLKDECGDCECFSAFSDII